MKTRFLICGTLACLALSSAANAAVLMGEVTDGNPGPSGASFVIVIPSATNRITVVEAGSRRDSPNLFALNEKQHVTLLRNISTLAAGTVVNSHLVWYDPAIRNTLNGTVIFNRNILAVITTRNGLRDTNGIFGNPFVTYATPSAVGLETRDGFSFSGNTLTVNFTASEPGDVLRVLTSAVPEPSTWMMLILGFGFIGAALRTQRGRKTITPSFAF